MFEVISKQKGTYTTFATIKSDKDHYVYLSAYGRLVKELADKYLEGQRADNEELFAKWDEAMEKAKSQTGFTATLEAEDGYVYITTFQQGTGVSTEN